MPYQVATKQNPTMAGSILTDPPKPKPKPKPSPRAVNAARRTLGN